MGVPRSAALALRMGGILPPPRVLRIRPAEGLPFPCRVFDASGPSRRARAPIVVAHGFSLLGPDDGRLDRFCAALAGAGFRAWLPRMEGLSSLDIDPDDALILERTALAALEDARAEAEASAEPSAAGKSPQVALAGFSLGAVMALKASAAPSLDGRLSLVLSASAPWSLASLHAAASRRESAHPYARLALLWRERSSLGLSDAEIKGWRSLMLRWWEIEGRFTEIEEGVIRGLSSHPLADGIVDGWRNRLEGLAGRFDLESSPVLGLLGKRRVPLFVMHGAGDSLVPPDSAHRIAARARKAGSRVRILVIPSKGHFAFGLGAAVRLLSFLGAFLKASRRRCPALPPCSPPGGR